MRKLWVRVGMSLEITDEEEKILFSDDLDAGAEVIKKVMSEGRAMVDGETYSPAIAVEDFNATYGTNHAEEDRSWDL